MYMTWIMYIRHSATLHPGPCLGYVAPLWPQKNTVAQCPCKIYCNLLWRTLWTECRLDMHHSLKTTFYVRRWFQSECNADLPSCKCMDFKRHWLPCKHLSLVILRSDCAAGWNKLLQSYCRLQQNQQLCLFTATDYLRSQRVQKNWKREEKHYVVTPTCLSSTQLLTKELFKTVCIVHDDNVGYVTVALFLLADEWQESTSAAVKPVLQWNPQWQASHVMTTFMNNIQHCTCIV